MDNKTPESQKPEKPMSDRKAPPFGGNVVWYLILLGVATLFFVSFLGTENQVEIPYMDLWKLIEQAHPRSIPKPQSRWSKALQKSP